MGVVGVVARDTLGECGLCQQVRALRKSHCIPAAALRRCRDEHRHPVHVTAGKVYSTSFQPRKPFLCASCESKFSERGEKHVLESCMLRRGVFPLRTSLETVTGLRVNDRAIVFTEDQVPEYDLDAFYYFAVSVFWRFSATRWAVSKTMSSSDEIGAKYREQLRVYLNDETAFPNSATIMISVSGEGDLHPMVVWPSSANVGGYHRHTFYVPGIEFRLFLGNRVPVELRSPGGSVAGKRLIFVEQFKKGVAYQWLREEATRSRRVSR